MPTFGEMHSNVTCSSEPRKDIDDILFDPNFNIDYFICATDSDNSFGGSMDLVNKDLTFMYARSSGFTGWNKTVRGATIITVHECLYFEGCDRPDSYKGIK